ncbi:hypothetical protein PIB30_072262 [Stylosanthes scabra]|uniref:Uncharacterized protein n=1 Tax=Stylosanthes scabra TaxID=79078 RepID=A0ABU6RP57_9FABA|nr:hypothetical protein [Stylosanthes scabra]
MAKPTKKPTPLMHPKAHNTRTTTDKRTASPEKQSSKPELPAPIARPVSQPNPLCVNPSLSHPPLHYHSQFPPLLPPATTLPSNMPVTNHYQENWVDPTPPTSTQGSKGIVATHDSSLMKKPPDPNPPLCQNETIDYGSGNSEELAAAMECSGENQVLQMEEIAEDLPQMEEDMAVN